MYKVKVNGQYDYNIDKTTGELFINANKIDADIKQLNAAAWHIINDLQSYSVELVDFNKAEK
ncbi:MAG: acetyl-CoA carboxylase biotin carboxyl carrier protein subunit, partial [Mucilaginibacter sp.]|nr:acetyl-CoA carboxylase biotin carboxyl carrier protein subunit [Mucilaginibacter sp.]